MVKCINSKPETLDNFTIFTQIRFSNIGSFLELIGERKVVKDVKDEKTSVLTTFEIWSKASDSAT